MDPAVSCDPGTFGPETDPARLLANATKGHPQAMDEWMRRRAAAEAAGLDPDAADRQVMAEVQAERRARLANADFDTSGFGLDDDFDTD